MKILIVIFVLIIVNLSYPKAILKNDLNSIHHYGIYAGINFNYLPDMGGNFQLEYNFHLIKNISIDLAIGYTKSYKARSNLVKTNYRVLDKNNIYYMADSYIISEEGYDKFPVSIGAQYTFIKRILSPYIKISVSSNFINAKTYHSHSFITAYSSYNDLPNEYKTP